MFSRLYTLPLIACVLFPLGSYGAVSDINVPAQINVNAGPLGVVGIGGALDGYSYAQDNAPDGEKMYGSNIANGMIHITDNSGFVGFNIWAGANHSNLLGSISKSPNYTPFGAMRIGYITLNLNKNLQLGVGQLTSPEGLESFRDYANSNIFRTTLWNVETGSQRGVQIQYKKGPFYAYLSWTDGYYTNRYNYIEYLLSYNISKKNNINFFGGANLGKTGYLTPQSGNIAENNSTMFGAWLTYNIGRFTLTPEIQYQYTGKNLSINLPTSSSNITAVMLSDYKINKNYSIGSFIEYAKGFIGNNAFLNNPTLQNNADYLGYGLNSSLYGISLTPTYDKGNFFARVDLAYIHVSNLSNDSGFGKDGSKNGQFSAIAEAGILF